GVPRQLIPFKRLSLTDFTLPIQRNARAGTISAASKKLDLVAKWDASSWAKKRARKITRASMTDFDRFKVMIARKQKSAIIAKKVAELQAAA
uniref:60S ribosomal protein L14 n=1 Tax=Salmonella sp. s29873 TaxID=3159634 RepID=UPI00397F792C